MNTLDLSTPFGPQYATDLLRHLMETGGITVVVPMKPQPECMACDGMYGSGLFYVWEGIQSANAESWLPYCPLGQPGDVAGVREDFSAWFIPGVHWSEQLPDCRDKFHSLQVFYRLGHNFPDDDQKWVPASDMPDWAIRTFLTLESVAVKRAGDVDHELAMQTGCKGFYSPMHPEMGETDGKSPGDEFNERFTANHGDLQQFCWVARYELISDRQAAKGE